MEFPDVIKKRYSVRAYKGDPVEKKKLEKVLEAGRLAPTAVNYQPFKLVVIKTAGRDDELKRIYPAEWFRKAPYVIGVCTIRSEAWTRRDGKSYVDVDGAIVMDHIILAATSLGLGTCWIGAFNPDAAREVLALPDDVEPLVFTPLGYAADEPRVKMRKSLDELVKYEGW